MEICPDDREDSLIADIRYLFEEIEEQDSLIIDIRYLFQESEEKKDEEKFESEKEVEKEEEIEKENEEEERSEGAINEGKQYDTHKINPTKIMIHVFNLLCTHLNLQFAVV